MNPTVIPARAKLGIGPMSSEVIEAAFRFSQERKIPLMLIASKNQIDWNGGYVNNWNTTSYGDFVKTMRSAYPEAQVLICRDHCGPGFKTPDLSDTYRSIEIDIENNFDLIHIDFCHYGGSKRDKMEAAAEAIAYVLKLAPHMEIEVGTDENTGEVLENVGLIEDEMRFFTERFPIRFFVCSTSSLTKEINQRGSFNATFLRELRPIADRLGVELKEHNADYLSATEIRLRKGLIHAVNVAPQFGVLQTQITLAQAFTRGESADDFLNAAYERGRWKKWLDKHGSENKHLCALIAGHYVFAGDAYKKLYDSLNRNNELKEEIITKMMSVFKMYTDNL